MPASLQCLKLGKHWIKKQGKLENKQTSKDLNDFFLVEDESHVDSNSDQETSDSDPLRNSGERYLNWYLIRNS